MGLLRSLRDRGYAVQPFKSGPDYIDPLFHQLATGTVSVNLDTFMASPHHVEEIFHHYGDESDVCVVEGAMGLFDGYDGMQGSAASLAMLLDLPVLLLVNAKSVSYSVAPLIYGFRHFCPQLKLLGVVFNFVSSAKHYQSLRKACDDAGVQCFGYLPKNSRLVIPSRHLGLDTDFQRETEELINLAAQEVNAHIDVSRILEML